MPTIAEMLSVEVLDILEEEFFTHETEESDEEIATLEEEGY